MKQSLKEWRVSQGWSRVYLANLLTKRMNQLVTHDYIGRIEEGQHPLYNVGIELQKMAKNQINFSKE